MENLKELFRGGMMIYGRQYQNLEASTANPFCRYETVEILLMTGECSVLWAFSLKFIGKLLICPEYEAMIILTVRRGNISDKLSLLPLLGNIKGKLSQQVS